MNDSVAEEFAKLNERGLDPNAFVTIEEGKRIRAAVRAEHQRQKKCLYNRDRRKGIKRKAERKIEAKGRTTEWRRDNPDKARAIEDRRPGRDYHRPFVSIDAEGRSFPNHDLRDKDKSVYPLHRTILWGAAGWKRDESFAIKGDPTIGSETAAHWLYHDDESPVSSEEIIEWLLSLPERYDESHGFRGDVNFVAFSFNYDVMS